MNKPTDIYTWVDFYQKFADKLLEFRNKQPELIERLKKAYEIATKLDFPKLFTGNPPQQIDPFSVFGLFNKQIKGDYRFKIISTLQEEFAISAQKVQSLVAIPRLNNFSSLFYGAENERGIDDINNLWDLFEQALKYADDTNDNNRLAFISTYDKVQKQPQSKWNISMGLFWIRPNFYLNLDTTNRKRLKKEETYLSLGVAKKIRSTNPPNGETYLEICQTVRKGLATGNYPTKTFLEFSWPIEKKQESISDNTENTTNPQIQTVVDNTDNNKYADYTKADFLKEVFLSEEQYNSLVNLLEHKKNIILQGAPGVGKTFAAERLAWSMIGEKNNEQIELIQFHQNYSYEDFIMGYKPVENGFQLKEGVFYRFCQKAQEEKDKKFFFIIDEINRGNLSKIFGELLMLIEKDYRNKPAKLAYDNRPFFVPDNLYIIGMMNTADRSLALIDYALRRRFSFFEIEPNFSSDGFQKYQKDLNNDIFNQVVDKIKELNKKIYDDSSLGKGFCIGHSYFCGIENNNITEQQLRSIVDYDILPMLNEYWFDDNDKVMKWVKELKGVFE